MAYVRKPYFKYPQANGLRMVMQTGPVEVLPVGVGQNWLNTLYESLIYPGTTGKCKYYEKIIPADTSNIQFRSSYATHTFQIKRESDNVVQKTITVNKLTNYVEQADSRPGNFVDAGSNQTQVYFSGGMPDFYYSGVEIVVSGNASFNGTYVVQDVRPGSGSAEGYEVLIINKVWPGGAPVQTATVATTYDIEPFDYYQADAGWSDVPVGKYYILLTSTHLGFTTMTARSEPIEVAASWDDCLVMEYKCVEAGFLCDYSGGLTHRMRLECFLTWPTNGGEREMMEDSRRKPVVLRDHVTLLTDLQVFGVPWYIANRIAIALAHDVVLIEGTEYSKVENVEATYFEVERGANIIAKLRVSDYEAENSNDNSAGDVDVLEVNGILLRVSELY